MQERLHILHVISSLEMGGAQAVLSDLVRALPADKYTHTVIYFHEGPCVARLQALGISVYQVRGALCAYDPVFWWRMLCVVRTLKPDIIHASLWSAGFVCRMVSRLTRIPVVTAVHALFAHHGPLRCALDVMTSNKNDTFIAVSSEVACSINSWLPARAVRVIRNGIDVSHIRTLRAESGRVVVPGLQSDHFVIGSVGRFVPVKRYELLLDTFASVHARHANARLLLIGVGPLESRLRAQAAQLGIAHAVFFVIGQLALPLYPHMHCFVQTSAHEGLSIALLEAMATGVPCITTSHSGQHALICHGINGMVVNSDDSKQLASYIEKLMVDAALRVRLGLEAAATIAGNYSVESMCQGYEEVFDRLIKKENKNSF